MWLNSQYPKVMWVRALELTQRGQPHHHLIVSFGPSDRLRARCEKRARYDRRWRGKRCDCLEHVLSVQWNRIVPDSYVVDCREANPDDAGYLAKYVGKANQISAALVELGFTRTWSRSRSWPVERFQLVPTMEDAWKKISATYPSWWKEMAHNGMSTRAWIDWTDVHGFLSVGTDLNWEMDRERDVKRRVSVLLSLKKEMEAFDYKAQDNRYKVGAGR